MARPTHYVPVISRPVVAELYHEARRHRIPMTRLVDCLLRESILSKWENMGEDSMGSDRRGMSG